MILTLPLLLAAPLAQGTGDRLGAAYLVTVKPGPQVAFHNEKAPGSATFAPRRAYVVAGNILVADEVRGNFTHVTYVNTDGVETAGWIASASLMPARKPFLQWQGVWKGWSGQIDIGLGKKPGTLSLDGTALWGAHDPARIANGGVHTGAFEVEAPYKGDRVAFSLGEGTGLGTADVARPFDDAPGDSTRCRVKLRLLGPYLLAEDNNQCGGVNVTFTGTYRRKSESGRP